MGMQMREIDNAAKQFSWNVILNSQLHLLNILLRKEGRKESNNQAAQIIPEMYFGATTKKIYLYYKAQIF